MLWDRGTYSSDVATASDEEDAIREGLRRGDLKITFHGERLHGSYALIRMKFARDGSSSKPQWLLIKHRDEFASGGGGFSGQITFGGNGRGKRGDAFGESTRRWRKPGPPKTNAIVVSSRKSEG